jgi:hypothetical protein
MGFHRRQMDQNLLVKSFLLKKRDLLQSSMQLWSDFAQSGCEFARHSPKT